MFYLLMSHKTQLLCFDMKFKSDELKNGWDELQYGRLKLKDGIYIG